MFALLALVGWTVNTLTDARLRPRYPAPGRLVAAGGYRLHVNCGGEGSPAVVFESGYGGTSLDWALVQPEIAKSTRTCSYDRAGYGWSDAAPSHTLDRMRHDFDIVLREAGPGPYVLVAHSFGGLLALDYASKHPDRVAGFVFALSLGASESIAVSWSRKPPDWCCHSLA